MAVVVAAVAVVVEKPHRMAETVTPIESRVTMERHALVAVVP